MGIIYDRFQQEAIEGINSGVSVLVSAPTGAGKTAIAEYAIEKCMREGKRVIYTAPIKALSNQKYRDFKNIYGKESVGILTGDVSMNKDAPIVIMTTEIYRNTLFDDLKRVESVAWVIYDEIHYIDDLERGTVWEESLIFSPKSVNFIGLSATVPNIKEFARWLEEIHGRKIKVVMETKRPVPLKHRFQAQGKILLNMKRLLKEGYLSRPDWQYRRPSKRRIRPNRLHGLIRHLRDADELPAIFFVFSRQRARFLAEESISFNFLKKNEAEAIRELYWKLCEKYEIASEPSSIDLFPLIEKGIAYHHAGMLPSLKAVVEELFTEKMLRLIFTTETFALGINMPARSVVFDELRKFYGTHFGNLKTRDYYQMAGRAGRRGMDKRGYVYSRINPKYISYGEVQRIIYSKPESVRSQFNAAYATVLNMYRNYGDGLIDIYPETFHYFQSSKNKRKGGYRQLENKVALLKEMNYIIDGKLTDKGGFASTLYGYELQLSEMYADTFLDTLSSVELSALLAAIVFEPRKKDTLPSGSVKKYSRLVDISDRYIKKIHKKEIKYKLRPLTKRLYFNLARPMEAWLNGAEFCELLTLTNIDEGEIVRYFRMVVQLLRELYSNKQASPILKTTAKEALKILNRDYIDAAEQLDK